MIKNKKFILALIVVLVLNTFSLSFAQTTVTDISDTWGTDTIQSVVDKGILATYDDDTFKPKQPVTKLEVLVAVYKALDYKNALGIDDVTALVNTYEEAIETANIPIMLAPYGGDDIYPAVAYALDRELITAEELESYVNDAGELTEVNKIETSVIIGKALNLFKKEDLNKIIDLGYKDAFEISYSAAPYVDLLIQYDIVSPQGDGNGNFNPESQVTREILSVFIANFIETVEMNTSTDHDTTSPVSSAGDGMINSIYTAMNVIEIEDANDKILVYDYDDPIVTLNNHKITMNNLEVGQRIEYSVENGEVVKINVVEEYNTMDGKVHQISKEFTPSDGESYRVLTITKADGSKGYLKMMDNTYISLNNQSVDYSELSVGDQVYVEYEDTLAKSIKAFGANTSLYGVLRRPLDDNRVLSITLNDGEVFTRTVDFTDSSIARGDIVKVQLAYGDVEAVESTGKSALEKGTIRKIVISDEPKLTLETEDGLETFEFNTSYEVKTAGLNDSLEIYDLRLDDYCEVKLNGIGINEVIISEPEEKLKFKAEVVSVHASSNVLKVTNDSGEEVVVSAKSGSNISMSNYLIGDELYIYGVELSEDLFEAEEIIIID